MKLQTVLVLATASVSLALPLVAQNFGATVVSYNPGTGYADGFTNTAVVLGAPSTVNPFGEAVDPFNPPYGTNQVLSIGEGGSVIIRFDKPVHNRRTGRQSGIDFLIFGNAGFVITNDFDPVTFSWIGEPATDGTLFAANQGQTRVSVSRNGTRFYVLNPESAPLVDALLPADPAGDPGVAANPGLAADNFAGRTLEGIRELYAGSAGGAGYDISWAQTERGRRAHLSSIRYVKIEVLSGKSEVDAISATAKAGHGR